jgi:hypothetical protein
MAVEKLEVAEVYEAIDSGTCELADGSQHVIIKERTRLHRDHPVRLAQPHMFKPLAIDVGVESATSAPGEKRGSKSK